MQNLKSSYEEKIQNTLRNFFGSRSIDDFCIDIGNNFLISTEQIEPPFSLLKLISQKRIKVIFDKTILVSGMLEAIIDGFILKINPEKIKNKQYYNLTLAHEIAHTYFFNTNARFPNDVSGLLTTSPELEYMCNKIARFLIIPPISLKSILESGPIIGSDLFSFKIVIKLCEIYQTTQYVILKRCIHDELHWNALFVKFKFFKNDKTWKLDSIIYPQYLASTTNKSSFFVPKGVSKDKIPSAKGRLADFLNKTYVQLKSEPILNKTICLKEVIDAPLHSIFNKEKLNFTHLVYLSLDVNTDSISLLIPLNESIYGFKNLNRD